MTQKMYNRNFELYLKRYTALIFKMKDIIYIVQPAELIGTKRYKIGRSSQPDLTRCKKGYKKGTDFICVMSCIESELLENKIKECFNKKFKLIAGREYYEGNENSMINEFLLLVLAHRKQCNKGYDVDEEETIKDKVSTCEHNKKKIYQTKPKISQNKQNLINRMKKLTLSQLREIADINDIYGCKTKSKQFVIDKLMDMMTQKDLNECIMNL